jgi:hypothetical protein
MKKSLVLAMAMALGVTASAYAANPFSDVPAGHWAYDSISKLAAAGVIEGYGDDTFRGDRLMTRYEMAQIVAKAMAKGANVDKLAAEFADELDALGVRVAALEKKADNVKITGQIRWHYANVSGDAKSFSHQLRTRIFLTGKVNDNWNYVTMLENRSDKTDYLGDEGTATQRAFLQGRLGGAKIIAGRYQYDDITGGNEYSQRADGIQIAYGDKVKLGAYAHKTSTTSWKNLTLGKAMLTKDADGNVIADPNGYGGNAYSPRGYAWGVNAAAELGKNAGMFVGYDRYNDKDLDNWKQSIFSVGLNGKFNDFGLGAIYLHGSGDGFEKKNGFIISADYKGANFNKPGTWGLQAKYYHQGDATWVAHEMNGTIPEAAFKGYKLAAYYTLAKGMRAGIEWYDLKGQIDDTKARTLWTELQVRF